MTLGELRQAVADLDRQGLPDDTPVRMVLKAGSVKDLSEGCAFQPMLGAVTFTERKGR